MISKQKIKFIHSLELKKFRDQLGLFLAEGPKVIEELIGSFRCTYLCATEEWVDQNKSMLATIPEIDIITKEELQKASLLKNPQSVIGIFEKKQNKSLSSDIAKSSLCLALDNVQDPGNLGTIIRIANWFGIKDVICSTQTADVFSPKVIQATMGALSQINVYYTDLANYLNSLDNDIPIYGTFLEGKNIYSTPLSSTGIIVMGNEGRGISSIVEPHINTKLFIPPYPVDADTVESLNVGVATAITCAEFRRRSIPNNK